MRMEPQVEGTWVHKWLCEVEYPHPQLPLIHGGLWYEQEI